MNTKFPVKRVFSQDFVTKSGKNLITIEYDQATIKEYFEYLQKTDEQKLEEILDILRKSLKYTLKDKILRVFGKDKISKVYRGMNKEEVFGSIFANRYRIYTSIFEKTRKVEKGLKKKEKKTKGIESVSLAQICSEFHMSPTDLMENYTLEQYFWFLDGIQWKANSGTKEGQLLNELAIADKDGAKERAERTRETMSKLKKH